MSQIVQVQSGKNFVRLPDLSVRSSLEKALLTDAQFDAITTSSFTSYVTDLGPGVLSAVVSLSTAVEAGQVLATWSPGFAGSIRSVMALVTTAVTTGSKAATFGVYIDQTAGTSEVNTVTITGSPTGGTFTLTIQGQTTSGIAYNASAATVQTAIEALAAVKVGDVTVTGSNGGPYTVTWGGALAETNVTITATASLTGGTAPGVTVGTTTGGVANSSYFTAVNGGSLALTSAAATPVGKALVGTNVKYTAANPNTFTANSTIQLRATAVTAAFSEGVAAFLLFTEPKNPNVAAPIW